MMYVSKVESGNVNLYDVSNGSLQRTFYVGDAVSAQVQDSTVAITKSNGQVDIYNADNGSLERTIY